MASGSGSDVIRVLSWNINGLKDKLQNRKTALLKIFDQYDVVLLQETKIGKMKDDKVDPTNRKIMTKGLKKAYARQRKDQPCREDNQEEEEEEEEDNFITEALSEKYDLVKLEDDEEEEEETRREETMRKTMYMTHFSSRRKGVAILVNKPHTLLSSFSEGGDYAWVHVEIDGQKYTFVSVYYHHANPHLIDNLRSKISTERSDVSKCRLVIGGDFNTTLDPELDATKTISDHTERRETLNEFLRAVKLIDVWREEHPGERKYTHTPTQSRIDYVFILEDDVKYVTSCEILNDIVLSDHSPVSLTLNYTNDRRV